MELPVTAVYDANVLYSAPLRDLLIRLAMAGLVRARWTDSIHEEWMRNLALNHPNVTCEKAARVRDLMNVNVRDCLVTGYESLTESLTLPDPDDRHVLAAAIHSGAEAIITLNLKDFPHNTLASYGIAALHPDEFVTRLIDTAPDVVCMALKRQREGLRSPAKTAAELLVTFERQGLVQSVARLKQLVDLL
ncbi:hypothetical protein BH10PLA2_BH10PLA2_05680 [soil metagenome]